MLASASHFGIPWPSYRLIGVAELAAIAGVLAGLYWLPIGVAAASVMAALLMGAVTVHRQVGDGPQRGSARSTRFRSQPGLPRRGHYPLTAPPFADNPANRWRGR